MGFDITYMVFEFSVHLYHMFPKSTFVWKKEGERKDPRILSKRAKSLSVD